MESGNMETNSSGKVQGVIQGGSELQKHEGGGDRQGAHSRGYTESRKDTTARPCAVIGPESVGHSYTRKDELGRSWNGSGGPTYYQHSYYPPRNISPRQSFQENMSRIVVPSPSEVKNYQEVSDTTKPNTSSSSKYCEGAILIKPPHMEMLRPPYYPPPAVDYQRYPEYATPRIQVIKGAQMFSKVPEQTPYIFPPTPNYPCKAFTRVNSVRYEPYPQIKDKYVQSARYIPASGHDYTYQYPGHVSPLSAIEKLNEVKKRLAQPSEYPLRYFPAPAVHNVDYHPKVSPSVPVRRSQHSTTPHYPDVAPGPQIDPYGATQSKLYGYNVPPDKTQYNYTSRSLQEVRSKQNYYPQYGSVSYQEPRLMTDGLHNSNYVNKPPTSAHTISYAPVNVAYSTANLQSYQKSVDMSYSDRTFDYDPAYYRYYQKHAQQPPIGYNPLDHVPTQFSPNIISPAESNASCNSVTTLPPQSLEDGGYVSQCSTSSGRSSDPNAAHVKDNFLEPRAKNKSEQSANNSSKSSKSASAKDDKKSPIDLRQYYSTWVEEYEDTPRSQETPNSSESVAVSESSSVVDNIASVPPHKVYGADKVNVPSAYPAEKLIKVPNTVYSTNSNVNVPLPPHGVYSTAKTNVPVSSYTVFSNSKANVPVSRAVYCAERSNAPASSYGMYAPGKSLLRDTVYSMENPNVFVPQRIVYSTDKTQTPPSFHGVYSMAKINVPAPPYSSEKPTVPVIPRSVHSAITNSATSVSLQTDYSLDKGNMPVPTRRFQPIEKMTASPYNSPYSAEKAIGSVPQSVYSTEKINVPVPSHSVYSAEKVNAPVPVSSHTVSSSEKVNVSVPSNVYTTEKTNVPVPPHSVYSEKVNVHAPSHNVYSEKVHSVYSTEKVNVPVPTSVYTTEKTNVPVPPHSVYSEKVNVPALSHNTYNRPKSNIHSAEKGNAFIHDYYRYNNINTSHSDSPHDFNARNMRQDENIANQVTKRSGANKTIPNVPIVPQTQTTSNETSNVNEMIDVEARISQSIIHKDVVFNYDIKPIEMKIEIAPGYNPTCSENSAPKPNVENSKNIPPQQAKPSIREVNENNNTIFRNNADTKSYNLTKIDDTKPNTPIDNNPQYSSQQNKVDQVTSYGKRAARAENEMPAEKDVGKLSTSNIDTKENNKSSQYVRTLFPENHESSFIHPGSLYPNCLYNQPVVSAPFINTYSNNESLVSLTDLRPSCDKLVQKEDESVHNNRKEHYRKRKQVIVAKCDDYNHVSQEKIRREENNTKPVHETVLKYVSTSSNIQHNLVDLSSTKLRTPQTNNYVENNRRLNKSEHIAESGSYNIGTSSQYENIGDLLKTKSNISLTSSIDNNIVSKHPTNEISHSGLTNNNQSNETSYQLCGERLSANCLERTKSNSEPNKGDKRNDFASVRHCNNNIIKHNIDNIILTNADVSNTEFKYDMHYKYHDDFESQIVATDLSMVKNYDNFEYIPKINNKPIAEIKTVDTPLRTPEIAGERLEEMGLSSIMAKPDVPKDLMTRCPEIVAERLQEMDLPSVMAKPEDLPKLKSPVVEESENRVSTEDQEIDAAFDPLQKPVDSQPSSPVTSECIRSPLKTLEETNPEKNPSNGASTVINNLASLFDETIADESLKRDDDKISEKEEGGLLDNSVTDSVITSDVPPEISKVSEDSVNENVDIENLTKCNTDVVDMELEYENCESKQCDESTTGVECEQSNSDELKPDTAEDIDDNTNKLTCVEAKHGENNLNETTNDDSENIKDCDPESECPEESKSIQSQEISVETSETIDVTNKTNEINCVSDVVNLDTSGETQNGNEHLSHDSLTENKSVSGADDITQQSEDTNFSPNVEEKNCRDSQCIEEENGLVETTDQMQDDEDVDVITVDENEETQNVEDLVTEDVTITETNEEGEIVDGDIKEEPKTDSVESNLDDVSQECDVDKETTEIPRKLDCAENVVDKDIEPGENEEILSADKDSCESDDGIKDVDECGDDLVENAKGVGCQTPDGDLEKVEEDVELTTEQIGAPENETYCVINSAESMEGVCEEVEEKQDTNVEDDNEVQREENVAHVEELGTPDENTEKVVLEVTSINDKNINFDVENEEVIRHHIESQYHSFQLAIDSDLISADGNILYCRIESPTSVKGDGTEEERYYLQVDSLSGLSEGASIAMVPCETQEIQYRNSADDVAYIQDDSCAPWIEDVACVETVVSEEVVCDEGDESQQAYSPEPLWGPNSCSQDQITDDELPLTPQSCASTLSRENSKDPDYVTLINNDPILEESQNNISENEFENLSLAMSNEDHSSSNFSEIFLKTATSVEPPKRQYDQELINVLTGEADCYKKKEDLMNVLLGEDNSDSDNTKLPETIADQKDKSCDLNTYQASTPVRYVPSKTIQPHNDEDSDNSVSSKASENISNNTYYKNDNNSISPGKLITKGAQKYIPPVNVNLNLKCQLRLPEEKLLSLKKLNSKKDDKPNEKGVDKGNETTVNRAASREDAVKKVKPKFDDVLKDIDETNLTWCKMKLRKYNKTKATTSIPKVIIKKSDEGSHYTTKLDDSEANKIDKPAKLPTKPVVTKPDDAKDVDQSAVVNPTVKKRITRTKSVCYDPAPNNKPERPVTRRKSICENVLSNETEVNNKKDLNKTDDSRKKTLRYKTYLGTRKNNASNKDNFNFNKPGDKVSNRRRNAFSDVDACSSGSDISDRGDLISPKEKTLNKGELSNKPAKKIGSRRKTVCIDSDLSVPKQNLRESIGKDAWERSSQRLQGMMYGTDLIDLIFNDVEKVVQRSPNKADPRRKPLSDNSKSKTSSDSDGSNTNKPQKNIVNKPVRGITYGYNSQANENTTSNASLTKPGNKIGRRRMTVSCDANEYKKTSDDLFPEVKTTKRKKFSSDNSSIEQDNNSQVKKSASKISQRRKSVHNPIISDIEDGLHVPDKTRNKDAVEPKKTVQRRLSICYIPEPSTSENGEQSDQTLKPGAKKVGHRRMTISYASPCKSDTAAPVGEVNSDGKSGKKISQRRMTVCYDAEIPDSDKNVRDQSNTRFSKPGNKISKRRKTVFEDRERYIPSNCDDTSVKNDAVNFDRMSNLCDVEDSVTRSTKTSAKKINGRRMTVSDDSGLSKSDNRVKTNDSHSNNKVNHRRLTISYDSHPSKSETHPSKSSNDESKRSKRKLTLSYDSLSYKPTKGTREVAESPDKSASSRSSSASSESRSHSSRNNSSTESKESKTSHRRHDTNAYKSAYDAHSSKDVESRERVSPRKIIHSCDPEPYVPQKVVRRSNVYEPKMINQRRLSVSDDNASSDGSESSYYETEKKKRHSVTYKPSSCTKDLIKDCSEGKKINHRRLTLSYDSQPYVPEGRSNGQEELYVPQKKIGHRRLTISYDECTNPVSESENKINHRRMTVCYDDYRDKSGNKIKKRRQSVSYEYHKRNKSPDLTGKRWQPYVSLRKNIIVEEMIKRNKCGVSFFGDSSPNTSSLFNDSSDSSSDEDENIGVLKTALYRDNCDINKIFKDPRTSASQKSNQYDL